MPLDGTDEVKQANAIGMFVPLLEGLDVTDKCFLRIATFSWAVNFRRLCLVIVPSDSYY